MDGMRDPSWWAALGAVLAAVGAWLAAGFALSFNKKQMKINSELVEIERLRAHRETIESNLRTRPALRLDGRVIEQGRPNGQHEFDVEVYNDGGVTARAVRVEARHGDGAEGAHALTTEGPLTAGSEGRFRFRVPEGSALISAATPLQWASGVSLRAWDEPTGVEATWARPSKIAAAAPAEASPGRIAVIKVRIASRLRRHVR